MEVGMEGNFYRKTKFLLFPSLEFLQQKYIDHRHNAIAVITVSSIIWSSLWAWDITVDPVGATKTFWLRVLFFGFALSSFIFIFCKKFNSWIGVSVVCACLIGEVLFLEILNRLHEGMVYGLAGFMYCMLVAVLLFQSFSLLINYAYTFLAALLPHIAGIVGFAHDFPHMHFAMLIWPAAILTAIAQTVQAYGYLRRFRLERKLKDLSNTDPLTEVKNRRYFMPLLNKETCRAVRTDQSLSLLLLDIDDFKNINDRYGHPVGDKVIRYVADICTRLSREIDTVARVGGEEFSILLIGSDLKQASHVAERIRACIAKSEVPGIENERIFCTVSIGIAELDEHEEDGNSLFSRADNALYQAKNAGRNKVSVA